MVQLLMRALWLGPNLVDAIIVEVHIERGITWQTGNQSNTGVRLALYYNLVSWEQIVSPRNYINPFQHHSLQEAGYLALNLTSERFYLLPVLLGTICSIHDSVGDTLKPSPHHSRSHGITLGMLGRSRIISLCFRTFD